MTWLERTPDLDHFRLVALAVLVFAVGWGAGYGWNLNRGQDRSSRLADAAGSALQGGLIGILLAAVVLLLLVGINDLLS